MNLLNFNGIYVNADRIDVIAQAYKDDLLSVDPERTCIFCGGSDDPVKVNMPIDKVIEAVENAQQIKLSDEPIYPMGPTDTHLLKKYKKV